VSERRGDEAVPPDEAETVARFIAFMREATAARAGSGPRRRFNQARATACVDAELTVPDDLAPELRVGLFAAPSTWRCTIRFANAASASDRERDIRGMSIRVWDVSGQNLTAGATVQDFVLNSHPVMMASDTRGFLELLQANEAGGFRRAMYFLSHPKAIPIALASRTNPTCHLDIPYWSATPYRFGPRGAVKYVAMPASPTKSVLPDPLTDTYLRDALRSRLAAGEALFDLMVQFQADRRRMPIEDAMVEWKREESPYVPVGRIRIPPQPIDGEGRDAACEAMAFNPWHCLAAHQPLGGMNRARREIYRAMASYRGAGASSQV
jgi:catalase